MYEGKNNTLGGLIEMNSKKRIGTGKQQAAGMLSDKGGHHVETEFLTRIGLRVYVPSASEIRAKSDIVQPFRGTQFGKEWEFRCNVAAGTALVRLIERFGLPNAPEYHDWSDDFMDFGREGTYWEYVFQVNDSDYFFVGHDHEELTVGHKGASAPKTSATFLRFIENTVNFPADGKCNERDNSLRTERNL